MRKYKKLIVLLLLCSLICGCGNNYSAYEDTTVNYANETNTEIASEEVVPEEVITEIEEGAYKDSSLESFVIPDGVTVIGKDAFAGSYALTTVTIPEGVTEIGESAFKDCTSLSEIILPESLEMIGDYAFYGCTGLIEITVPENVTEIGRSALASCANLNSVTLEGNNKLQSIGAYAFWDCVNLTQIAIPESVTKIGDGAFGNCTDLSYVDYTGNADGFPWGAPEGAFAYKENGFVYESHKKETLLGYTGKSTTITIPRGTVKIAEDSFTYFPFLESIYIPDTVTEIADNSFNGNYRLENIFYNGSADGFPWGAPSASIQSFDEGLIEELLADTLEDKAVEVTSDNIETSKGDVRTGNLQASLHVLSDKSDMNGPVEVPKEVNEEYERRKEEGFKYEPEKVYNDYSAFSDAEIIEMVNERYLELHNEKRRELGLSELKLDGSLNSVATIRAEEASYFFNHTRPNGKWCAVLIPWNEIEDQVAGENLEWRLKDESSILKNPRSIVYPGKPLYLEMADAGFEGLCNSPGHYATITHPEYKYIGIDSYIVRDKYGNIMIVTAFEFCTGAMY